MSFGLGPWPAALRAQGTGHGAGLTALARAGTVGVRSEEHD